MAGTVLYCINTALAFTLSHISILYCAMYERVKHTGAMLRSCRVLFLVPSPPMRVSTAEVFRRLFHCGPDRLHSECKLLRGPWYWGESTPHCVSIPRRKSGAVICACVMHWLEVPVLVQALCSPAPAEDRQTRAVSPAIKWTS